jgi:hypothetical protein
MADYAQAGMVLPVDELDSIIDYAQEAVTFDDHVANHEDSSIVITVGLKVWLIGYFVGIAGREMKAIGATFGGWLRVYQPGSTTGKVGAKSPPSARTDLPSVI